MVMHRTTIPFYINTIKTEFIQIETDTCSLTDFLPANSSFLPSFLPSFHIHPFDYLQLLGMVTIDLFYWNIQIEDNSELVIQQKD